MSVGSYFEDHFTLGSWYSQNAITKIKELILFFEKLREDGFQDLMEDGKELAKKVGNDPEFATKIVVCIKKQFDEDVRADANESQSHEDNFRVTYFFHIIDQALASLHHLRIGLSNFNIMKKSLDFC